MSVCMIMPADGQAEEKKQSLSLLAAAWRTDVLVVLSVWSWPASAGWLTTDSQARVAELAWHCAITRRHWLVDVTPRESDARSIGVGSTRYGETQ